MNADRSPQTNETPEKALLLDFIGVENKQSNRIKKKLEIVHQGGEQSNRIKKKLEIVHQGGEQTVQPNQKEARNSTPGCPPSESQPQA